MAIILAVALAVFGVACLTTYALLHAGGRLRILDHPNERSLHTTPTPRTGGLAIWAGLLVGFAAVLAFYGIPPEFPWIVSGTLLVGIVSFVDDSVRVPVGLRLIAHMVAAGLVLAGGLGLRSIALPGVELGVSAGAGALLAFLFLVWMTNLYNFMDGMDGFAGGMTVVGFGAYAAMGVLGDNGLFALANAIIAAAAAGFLVFNFPPARIFMGDVGSSSLGFLAGACTLWGSTAGLFPIWFGVLVFSPFVVDATVTLCRRAITGEKVWIAHRSHYYQRVVALGFGHRKTVLIEYLLMGSSAVSGGIAVRMGSVAAQYVLMAFWLALYASMMFAVARLERASGAKQQ